MISKELETKILRLYHAEHWRVGTIASQLGVHHTTVRRVLAQAGMGASVRTKRPALVDPYVPFIHKTLEQYPRLRASRLYEMVRERGYGGGPDHFRHLVALYRPRRPAEAFLRLRTLPGEQGQVDWAHFGTTQIGRAARSLSAFVLVLSYSRWLFVRFFLDQRLANFLRGHVAAFAAAGGAVRVLLYDNLKSVVLERRGDAIRFHPELLAFAAHYHFEPRPVSPARGSEKGRVERAIQYLRHSFFTARRWSDLHDLNAQVQLWCQQQAAERPWPDDRTLTVAQAFAQEQPKLLPLPPEPYPTHERVEVRAGKVPYVRFDGNDYSIPHTRVRRTLVVVADLETVRIFDRQQPVAEHRRSFSHGEQIEDLEHLKALVRQKRAARQSRAVDRLEQAAPHSRELLVRLAERGDSLGAATTALLRLLDGYGASDLDLAIAETLRRGVAHPHGVRHVLEHRRRQQGQPPPVPINLPDDPRVRDLVVQPHRLDSYDALHGTQDDKDTDHDPEPAAE